MDERKQPQDVPGKAWIGYSLKRLPREVMESPSIEVFIRFVDRATGEKT